MACRYCYEKHSRELMSEETALAAVDLMLSFGHKNNGFSFFGGEPLLCRGLIERVTGYAAEKCPAGGKLSYRITTNGLLLDERFMGLAKERDIRIALSHDGSLQDAQRVFPGGKPTSGLLEPKIDLLLKYQPRAVAMLTVMPENVSRFAEAVDWLYRRGFTRINGTVDYRPGAKWDDASMEELARQYGLIAALCEEHYDDVRPLEYMGFEAKIASYINDRPCVECRLGVRQPSIAPDGKIYPCNQFLNDPDYLMGDVWRGIDAAAQRRIIKEAAAEESSCRGCALEKRCRHHCACLNHSMTGDMHSVPPMQCAHEKALIIAADRMAEALYKRKSPRFMRAYGTE